VVVDNSNRVLYCSNVFE